VANKLGAADLWDRMRREGGAENLVGDKAGPSPYEVMWTDTYGTPPAGIPPDTYAASAMSTCYASPRPWIRH